MTNQTSHVASKHRHCTPQTSELEIKKGALHGCRWSAAGLTNTWRLSSFEDLGDIAVGVSEETPKNGVYRWPGGPLSISIWKEQWWIWTQPCFAYPTNDYLFLPAFKSSFLSGHRKYCGLSTSSWCVLGVSTPYGRCCTLRFRLLLNHFQMPGLGFHTQ